ncbi:hypothetical protein [Streptomyces sp. NPDC048341]|uniref:hypothetical protein n=1 Tax=Streptomyces sp. NPDC048341 TaxID=3154620 RepID=UPI0034367FA7
MSSIVQTQETASLKEARALYEPILTDFKDRLDRADAKDYDALLPLDNVVGCFTKKVTYHLYLALPNNDDEDAGADYWNWVAPAPDDPAARLVVEVDDFGCVEDARLEYRTAPAVYPTVPARWKRAPKQDRELVMRLAAVLRDYRD